MEPFDNFERWKLLKQRVAKDKDLVSIIQNILKCSYNRNRPSKDELKCNDDRWENIAMGRNRMTCRIGEGTSHYVEIDNQKMVLAVKIPYVNTDYKSTYASEEELDNPDTGYLLNSEVQRFEHIASLGREGPRVSGIVAGYGIIGTLTEDLTEGGTYKLKVDVTGSPETEKISPDGSGKVVCTDLKWGLPLELSLQEKSENHNYFLERLQIDRL